jgi:hypothetical protein
MCYAFRAHDTVTQLLYYWSLKRPLSKLSPPYRPSITFLNPIF